MTHSWSVQERIVAAVVLLSFGGLSCGGPAINDSTVTEYSAIKVKDHVPVADDAPRVLGFEDPRDWRSNARLARSDTHTEGLSALAVTTDGGRTFVRSVRLGDLPEWRPQLGFDLMVPAACEAEHRRHRKPAPNPPGGGSIRLFLDSPSVGLDDYLVGTADLAGFPPGAWRSVTFPLPPSVVDQLRARTKSDLTFTFKLDVPSGCRRTYRLDKLNKRPPGVRLPPGRISVESLRAEPDANRRALIAFFLLNGMCLMKRALSAVPLTPPERQLRDYLLTLDPLTRDELGNVGVALASITGAERAELLGPYANLDPGSCGTDPTSGVPPVMTAAAQALFQVPRMRNNSCQDTVTYEADQDPALATRAVTAGSEVLVTGDPIESVPAGHVAAARPVIMGIQKGDPFVSGYDAGPTRPSLERDRLTLRDCGDSGGDGYNPYGVETDIPCTLGAPCDAEAGLLCGVRLNQLLPAGGYNEARCYAFPIVTPAQNLVVKGYNYWDPRDALLEYVSLNDPARQPAAVGLGEQGVIGHEGTEPVPNCLIPVGRGTPGAAECIPAQDPGNRTHNTAMFPVPADLGGAFYRLRMMNHNTDQLAGQPVELGRFRHWNVPGEDGRVVHVCYPPLVTPLSTNALGQLVPLDARRSCAPPPQTCQQNSDAIGLCGSGTWSGLPGLRPRSLSQCRHLPGTAPVCGETPEWLYSEMKQFGPNGNNPRFPIVFASATAGRGFRLAQRMTGVRCIEETNWDFLGSDELRVATAAFKLDQLTGAMSGNAQFWDGGGFDSTGDTLTPPRLIMPPHIASVATSVGLNQSVGYSMALFERDCSDDDLACRGAWVLAALTVAVGVIYGITALCPPCGAVLGAATATVGGQFAVSAIAATYTLLLWESSRHDRLGAEIFSGTPGDFGERFTVSHLPGFTGQTEGMGIPGPLRNVPGAGNRGRQFNALTVPGLPAAETQSLGLKMIGFREHRQVASDGAEYFMQYLMQRIRCDSVAECQNPTVSSDPTQP